MHVTEEYSSFLFRYKARELCRRGRHIGFYDQTGIEQNFIVTKTVKFFNRNILKIFMFQCWKSTCLYQQRRVARESRLEGKWGVTRVSDNACVTPWKSRSQFLPNYHPTASISQVLPWMHKATRLTHSRICGSWKPRHKQVYIQDLSQSSTQKRLPISSLSTRHLWRDEGLERRPVGAVAMVTPSSRLVHSVKAIKTLLMNCVSCHEQQV